MSGHSSRIVKGVDDVKQMARDENQAIAKRIETLVIEDEHCNKETTNQVKKLLKRAMQFKKLVLKACIFDSSFVQSILEVMVKVKGQNLDLDLQRLPMNEGSVRATRKLLRKRQISKLTLPAIEFPCGSESIVKALTDANYPIIKFSLSKSNLSRAAVNKLEKFIARENVSHSMIMHECIGKTNCKANKDFTKFWKKLGDSAPEKEKKWDSKWNKFCRIFSGHGDPEFFKSPKEMHYCCFGPEAAIVVVGEVKIELPSDSFERKNCYQITFVSLEEGSNSLLPDTETAVSGILRFSPTKKLHRPATVTMRTAKEYYTSTVKVCLGNFRDCDQNLVSNLEAKGDGYWQFNTTQLCDMVLVKDKKFHTHQRIFTNETTINLDTSTVLFPSHALLSPTSIFGRFVNPDDSLKENQNAVSHVLEFLPSKNSFQNPVKITMKTNTNKDIVEVRAKNQADEWVWCEEAKNLMKKDENKWEFEVKNLSTFLLCGLEQFQTTNTVLYNKREKLFQSTFYFRNAATQDTLHPDFSHALPSPHRFWVSLGEKLTLCIFCSKHLVQAEPVGNDSSFKINDDLVELQEQKVYFRLDSGQCSESCRLLYKIEQQRQSNQGPACWAHNVVLPLIRKKVGLCLNGDKMSATTQGVSTKIFANNINCGSQQMNTLHGQTKMEG